jgi:hypothetical protein
MRLRTTLCSPYESLTDLLFRPHAWSCSMRIVHCGEMSFDAALKGLKLDRGVIIFCESK